ncbi:PaaI family thioesterase [Perlabentimonas gracilis]|uniref:PaaI family thioesterase n=1 Tax=Perlabentimonas gracilis TaxID=2715279 RepID=UPI00140D7D1D|nr:PaaI family thioesterase [Perlabentimonas gracilis]NHB68115.1 PaaI family thioesterase [Perlabentimonas gracilis]
MKKVRNPYVGHEGYGCLGCDPSHPFGLRLSFTFDEVEKILYAEWTPHKGFQGYTDVVHGGIQATLLDEIGGWAVNTILGTGGVTSQLQIRYKKPAHISDGPLKLKAWLVSSEKRLANIQTQLFNAKDELCAEAQVQYFVFPPEVAKQKLNFPGAEEFFEK